MPSMDQYLPIALLLGLGVAFAAGSFAASKLLGPSRPTGAKEGPYESGIAPDKGNTVRFPVRFFMVAMIFIIFDIEVVFLYPWAVVYHQLNRFGLAEMAAFAMVVFVSFAYLVSNGALDWGPGKRSARDRVDATRTISSSVRRVPRPSDVSREGAGTFAVPRTTSEPVSEPTTAPAEQEPVTTGS